MVKALLPCCFSASKVAVDKVISMLILDNSVFFFLSGLEIFSFYMYCLQISKLMCVSMVHIFMALGTF